jgi:hypothetical protein
LKDDLPPSDRLKLSAWGWLAVASSIAVACALVRIPYLLIAYFLFVAVGFLVGIPGGMHYQGDIDLYLSRNPAAKRDSLPWPADYTGLTRSQAQRYALRGLPEAVTYGVLFPVFLCLSALEPLGMIRTETFERVLSCLWRSPEGPGATQQRDASDETR